MDVDDDRHDGAVARLAAAIGEPARARMLYSLMDNHARTSTELAVIAGVSPATASVHLNRLKTEHLVKVHVQGKHRYYSLQNADVATLLEKLSVLSGSRPRFVPSTPNRLRAARTCYDHLAGTLGVSLHDRLMALEWLAESSEVASGTRRASVRASGTGGASEDSEDGRNSYDLTPKGIRALSALGVDIENISSLRRRFAFACLDWSERRSHIGGALGAGLLQLALKRRWVTQDLDIRAVCITSLGKRELLAKFGLTV
jgi:DNA-binding transcriptional ArsR family regulator